jgi:hypothetical protein
MNTFNPSVPPRGVREALLIAELRSRPLPRRSADEVEQLRRLSRDRSELPRLARHAPPCGAIPPEGGQRAAPCRSRFLVPGGTGMQPAAGPCTGFPPGITRR